MIKMSCGGLMFYLEKMKYDYLALKMTDKVIMMRRIIVNHLNRKSPALLSFRV